MVHTLDITSIFFNAKKKKLKNSFKLKFEHNDHFMQVNKNSFLNVVYVILKACINA